MRDEETDGEARGGLAKLEGNRNRLCRSLADLRVRLFDAAVSRLSNRPVRTSPKTLADREQRSGEPRTPPPTPQPDSLGQASPEPAKTEPLAEPPPKSAAAEKAQPVVDTPEPAPKKRRRRRRPQKAAPPHGPEGPESKTALPEVGAPPDTGTRRGAPQPENDAASPKTGDEAAPAASVVVVPDGGRVFVAWDTGGVVPVELRIGEGEAELAKAVTEVRGGTHVDMDAADGRCTARLLAGDHEIARSQSPERDPPGDFVGWSSGTPAEPPRWWPPGGWPVRGNGPSAWSATSVPGARTGASSSADRGADGADGPGPASDDWSSAAALGRAPSSPHLAASGLGPDLASAGWARVGGSADLARLGGSAGIARLGGSAGIARLGGSADLARLGGSADLARLGGSAGLAGGGPAGLSAGGSADLARLGGSADLARLGGSAGLAGGGPAGLSAGGSADLARLGGSSELTGVGSAEFARGGGPGPASEGWARAPSSPEFTGYDPAPEPAGGWFASANRPDLDRLQRYLAERSAKGRKGS